MNNLNKLNLNIKEIVLLCLFFILIIFIYISESSKPSEKLKVTFIDVGQGDSMLVQTPKNIKLLIDGGPDNKVSNYLGKNLSFLDTDIDIIVATHDDADHIFGLIKILENYKVKVLFTSLPNSTNPLMQKIIEVAKNKNVKIIPIQTPSIIKTEDGVLINFLFPTINLDKINDGNSASVVTQIIYGDIKILTTGDLPINGENYLIDKYGGVNNSENILKSNILKLGHHGSDTSSSPNFLQRVMPEIAVVPAGKNNKFGHPHKSVLDLLSKFNIPVRQTNEEGNINFEF